MTLSLFDRFDPFDHLPDDEGRRDGLMYFQEEAVQRVMDGFFPKEGTGYHSQLVVMATGTGKTLVMASLAKRWPHGSVLILAHRKELVGQNQGRLERMTGQCVELEQRESTAGHGARFVVGSVQTVTRRLDKIPKDRFSLVIVDEGHHFLAPTFKRVIDHFDCPVVGFTATPDRGDEKALGQIFENVAYLFDIEDGITEGFLVPIKGLQVDLPDIDLSGVDRDPKKKDLASGQLDDAMLKVAAAIADEVVKLEPNRQAICFFPGCKSAEFAMCRFNQLRPDSAIFIHAKTDPDTRDILVRDFKAGKYLYLCNVEIATEGFDAPDCSLIVMGRPTLSRSLYAQMLGRCTRAPASVYRFHAKEQHVARRSVIASSSKPFAMVMDFVGNSGKHSLMSPEDVLGGNFSESEVALAKKKRKGTGGDIQQALKDARAELIALAAKAKVSYKSVLRPFDPFEVTGMVMSDDMRYATRFGHKPASPGLLKALTNIGVKPEELRDLSQRAASKLMDELSKRRKLGLASYRQAQILTKNGIYDPLVSFDAAGKAIDYIVSNGWKVKDAKVLRSILYPGRQPGDEG